MIWIKPKKFDNNLLVIGAGAAGLVTAYIAAAVKAKVTLIEKQHTGGDCLNTGCVPSKALLRSAKFIAENRGTLYAKGQTAGMFFRFKFIGGVNHEKAYVYYRGSRGVFIAKHAREL